MCMLTTTSIGERHAARESRNSGVIDIVRRHRCNCCHRVFTCDQAPCIHDGLHNASVPVYCPDCTESSRLKEVWNE